MSIRTIASTIASATRRALAASERVRPVHAVLLGISGVVLLLWPADAWPVLLIAAGVAADAA
jgi:uncharacterized membrane protein HdeD (DUF308 family)